MQEKIQKISETLPAKIFDDGSGEEKMDNTEKDPEHKKVRMTRK